VFHSRINSEETRQNLTKTEEIVEACGRIPGYLCDAARFRTDLNPKITEDDLIERFKKRRNASRMLNNKLLPLKYAFENMPFTVLWKSKKEATLLPKVTQLFADG